MAQLAAGVRPGLAASEAERGGAGARAWASPSELGSDKPSLFPEPLSEGTCVDAPLSLPSPSRYLSREFPEDWPVSRLAQGFQVKPDIVRRVLRSHFSPSWERSLKQDGQVWARQSGRPPTGRGSQQPLALLTRESTFKLLPAGSRRAGAPRHVAPKACMAPLDSSASEAVPQKRAGEGQDVPCGASLGSDAQAEEEHQQGRFLSKEELEQLAAEGWESNLHVVQRGRAFFDEAGNLLYRIPAPLGD